MPTKPLAQPQRTQSAEGFLASEENRTGLARTSTLTWQAMCEFAEAYAQSLQQAAAPTGKCGLPHSLPTVYHPCCLAKGHNPEDMHLFMPIQVSETYYCNVQGCPRCGHNWKFGEISKETCGFHQCGCRHEWHAIPRMAAVPERGAPPEKPVCLICGLPPDHEWHGVSNHVYVPKLAGHDSAGAAQPKMKDDPVYGAIRVAICDEYIAAGSPTPKENWLYSRLVEARTQFAYEAGAANSPSPEVRQAWVSVTEKFPPDNQPVLVLRSNDWHRMQIEYYCKNGPYDSGFFLDGEMDTKVTHWMPLPPGPAAPPATKEGK